MKIKTVKIGLENTSDITIPYENVSYIRFDGKNISECDIDSFNLPNFEIRFRFDTSFFGNYIEEYEDWAQSDWYGVMNVILCYDDGTEKEIILPWKDNDTNSPAEYNHYEVTRHIERDVVIKVDKFNVYGYINSDAIGSYCQKIMHKFSAAESAYIVNSSNRHTLSEKHAMFNHITDTMPDEMIKTYTAVGRDKVSLHKTLKDYIKLQNKIAEDFKREDEGFVYSCLVYYMREFEPEEYGPYKTLNDLFDDIESFSNDVIGKIDVKKICLSDRRYASVVFNRDKEPVSVYSCLLNDDEENLAERFDLMWFVCPTPFKKGDILYAPNITRTYPPTPEVEPFVLDRLCYENADSRYFSNKYDHGDSTDMTATGYFQDDDGKIYMECMHDYLSLEYYNGRLDGKLRILKALSKYLKGEIPLDLLLNAYDIVMKEENLSKTKRYMNFLEQDLKDIGI